MSERSRLVSPATQTAVDIKLAELIDAILSREQWFDIPDDVADQQKQDAIIARDPPTAAEDPDFDPDDVRYSTVRYIANMTRNAMGPSVSDPRTGEIIESDIIWYHNHLRSYRNRLMVETGAANPAARSLQMGGVGFYPRSGFVHLDTGPVRYW